ncbi:MAG: phage capsid protein [Vagococcus salmoninarum]|uniref:phage capsid protein n=1 Tax=Vagococcus salmoninarum TaxID=2739 RepID=UPI003F96DC79
MPAEAGLNNVNDFGAIQQLDFVLQFQRETYAQLVEALGVTRLVPLQQDQELVTYDWTVDLKDGDVAEGEIIPLSKATRVKRPLIQVPIKKHRRSVSFEAIRRFGREIAERQATDEIRNKMNLDIQQDFADFLTTTPNKKTAANLQEALAMGWGYSREQFKNMGVKDYVTFVNALDVAKYLGGASLTNSIKTDFGFTILKDFLGLGTVIIYDNLSPGKTYTTAVNNIGLAYQDVSSSDVAQAFNLIADDLGFIGVYEGAPRTDNATKEQTFIHGLKLFVESPNAVIEMAIDGTVIDPGEDLGRSMKEVNPAYEQKIAELEKALAEATKVEEPSTEAEADEEVKTPKKK